MRKITPSCEPPHHHAIPVRPILSLTKHRTITAQAPQPGHEVDHFVAATNRNDVVPEFLRSGIYSPRPSVATISNAMDVGAPSNFVRMQALFGGSWEQMKSRISGMWLDDDRTRAAIREVKSLYDYEIDPHGAIGWLAARAWRAEHPCSATITLETAHPAKFPDVMEAELGPNAVEVPERLAILAHREKVAIPMGTDKAALLGHQLPTIGAATDPPMFPITHDLGH